MDNKKLAILIIAGIVLVLLGGVAGVIFQAKFLSPQSKSMNALSSKVISSIVAYGQVKNINGKNVTLSNLGDNLLISIADNAQVYSFTTPPGSAKNTAPVQQTGKFDDLKVGDNVNVAVKLLPTGQLEGVSVIILSQTVRK